VRVELADNADGQAALEQMSWRPQLRVRVRPVVRLREIALALPKEKNRLIFTPAGICLVCDHPTYPLLNVRCRNMWETTYTVLFTIAMTLMASLLWRNLSSPERKLDYDLKELALRDVTFQRCMSHLLGPPLVAGNRVRSLVNGDQIFPAMLAAIRSATSTITFETYIFWSGAIGREFTSALCERASAGVKVHVLLDWIGSNKLDGDSIAALERAGVEVERYRPLRWYNLSRMNSRTHRKLLVVDGRIGFIGGVGIADAWTGNAQSPEHWRDSHFELEGPAVAHLQAAFADNWMKTRAEVFNSEAYFPVLQPAGTTVSQVFKSSPREGGDSARLMFLLSISAARQRILIANSYFVPDAHTIRALVSALERGVTLEIIVPGLHIDTKLTRRASRSLWGPLLKAGASIYEYQPTMFHCKVMIIDDGWVTVGSTNFDTRSFRLNDEANLNSIDQDFATEQAQIFFADRERSRQVTLADWERRPWREKLVELLAWLFRSQV
jgi:cardiolipin synthase